MAKPTDIRSLKRSSYYEADYRQSAALIRARRPYIFKNLATGFVIIGFAVGVCEYCRSDTGWYGDLYDLVAFTLNAVGQDTFDDVIVPDAPADPPRTPNIPAAGIIR
jgi:cytochrome c oxidase assembly factor 3